MVLPSSSSYPPTHTHPTIRPSKSHIQEEVRYEALETPSSGSPPVEQTELLDAIHPDLLYMDTALLKAASSKAKSKKSFTVWKSLKTFIRLAKPYFLGVRRARLLLLVVVLLSLSSSALAVGFSYFGRDFWNAISTKNTDVFWPQLLKFLGLLTLFVPVVVSARYTRDRLANEWREWMTKEIMREYYSFRSYYHLELNRAIDNPDQRIAEDIKSFTIVSLRFLLTIMSTVIDFAAFSVILFSIDKSLFAAAIIYSGIGTYTTLQLGKSLVNLNSDQLQREADFRYSLVRVRENSESIAFYCGELLEVSEIKRRLKLVIANTLDIIKMERSLEIFTTSYRYLIQILPAAVVAPRYFSGSIQLGVISQSQGAFNHILSDLSIVINQFESLSSFAAGIERLDRFIEVLQRFRKEYSRLSPRQLSLHSLTSKDATMDGLLSDISGASVFGDENRPFIASSKFPLSKGHDPFAKIEFVLEEKGNLSVEGLTLQTPDRYRTLLKNISFALTKGDRLLVTGKSGSGKSSLLRAISGLWVYGEGVIRAPSLDDMIFLPQKPYCTLGTLRQQILYPKMGCYTGENVEGGVGDSLYRQTKGGGLLSAKEGGAPSSLPYDETQNNLLLESLRKVRLGGLLQQLSQMDGGNGLDSLREWSSMLSLGEQQRLAFCRVFIHPSSIVVLDEATSGLDIASEALLYNTLSQLENLVVISVGHRPSLRKYHTKCLDLSDEGEYTLTNIEKE